MPMRRTQAWIQFIGPRTMAGYLFKGLLGKDVLNSSANINCIKARLSELSSSEIISQIAGISVKMNPVLRFK